MKTRTFTIVAAFALHGAGASAAPAQPVRPVRPVATYSIVAFDPETKQLGAAVQSHWFSVGPVVPWVESGVGAVATQSLVEISHGPVGLTMMRAGRSAPEALAGLLASDEGRELRQLGVVDAQGRVAAHTGSKCIAMAGHHVGPTWSVQANLMERDTVWPAMARAFESAKGDLAARMLAALEAAESEGGDVRGRQSAALVVVSGTPTGQPWRDRIYDVRVDDHADPLKELARLLDIARAYRLLNEGDEHLAKDDVPKALAAYSAAYELQPDNHEIAFWTAVTLATSGKEAEALPHFRRAFEREPRWRMVLPRLVKSGLFPDDDALVARVLASP